MAWSIAPFYFSILFTKEIVDWKENRGSPAIVFQVWGIKKDNTITIV